MTSILKGAMLAGRGRSRPTGLMFSISSQEAGTPWERAPHRRQGNRFHNQHAHRKPRSQHGRHVNVPAALVTSGSQVRSGEPFPGPGLARAGRVRPAVSRRVPILRHGRKKRHPRTSTSTPAKPRSLRYRKGGLGGCNTPDFQTGDTRTPHSSPLGRVRLTPILVSEVHATRRQPRAVTYANASTLRTLPICAATDSTKRARMKAC